MDIEQTEEDEIRKAVKINAMLMSELAASTLEGARKFLTEAQKEEQDDLYVDIVKPDRLVTLHGSAESLLSMLDDLGPTGWRVFSFGT